MKNRSIVLPIFDYECTFTQEDISFYFDQLCGQILPLQKLQEEEIQHVLNVTRGNPLAVIVLAHRYCSKKDKRVLTEENNDLHQVTESIQQLLTYHASATQAMRAKLYSLALLRTIDDPRKICDSLGIGHKNKNSYDRLFRQFYQDYNFVFMDDTYHCFQEDIRYFIRHWLLKERKEQEISAIIKRIHENQQKRLYEIEGQYTYRGLHDRLNDERWTGIFLDLIEAQFWIDPDEGASYGITLLIAASLYHSPLVYEVARIGSFFLGTVNSPQLDWWYCAIQGLNVVGSPLQTYKRVTALENLKELIMRQKLLIPSPIAEHSGQLVAALWWQQGELYKNFSVRDACIHYEKALSFLVPKENVSEYTAKLYWTLSDALVDSQQRVSFLVKTVELQPDFADAYYNLGNIYLSREQYQSARTCYQYTTELQPHFVDAWINLGITHTYLKEYQRALDEFSYAQNLDSENVLLYYNRANVYRNLKMYDEALKDFDKAIELNNAYPYAYMNRGNIYAALKMRERAYEDYARASELLPSDIHPLWLQEWICFGKHRIGRETALRLKEIAMYDPDHYIAAVCMGVHMGLTEKAIKNALPVLEHARDQALHQWDAYFWLAMLTAYLGHSQQAEIALNKAVELGIPVAFMQPLYWLEKDRPEFFKRYAEPVLLDAHL